jgi:hypothetical protein
MNTNAMLNYNNLRIAHIVKDEKFTESIFDQWEAVYPGSNTYYLPTIKKNLKYVDTTNVSLISIRSFLDKKYLHELQQFDLIIIHSLTRFNAEIIVRLKELNSPPVLWVGMGYDYYDLIFTKFYDQYLMQTQDLLNSNFQLKMYLKMVQANTYLKGVRLAFGATKKDVIKMIDYFAPVLPSEYTLVNEAVPLDPFPKYVSWNYAVSAKFVGKDNGLNVDQSCNSILLGNSAYPNNNHADALSELSKLSITRNNIVMPLGYGLKSYARYLERNAPSIFNASYTILNKFIDYHEYVKILSTCPVAIMNHVRQQAAGNIYSMLYLGSNVFIREENPIYNHLIDMGCSLHSMQQLIQDPQRIKYRLTKPEINVNREILTNQYGWSASLAKTKAVVETILV